MYRHKFSDIVTVVTNLLGVTCKNAHTLEKSFPFSWLDHLWGPNLMTVKETFNNTSLMQ